MEVNPIDAVALPMYFVVFPTLAFDMLLYHMFHLRYESYPVSTIPNSLKSLIYADHVNTGSHLTGL